MKKLFLFAALLISQAAFAQQPIVPLELACPAGSAVLVGHQTLDASTGMFRQNVCVDNNGKVTMQPFSIITQSLNNILWAGPGNTPSIDTQITACGSVNPCEILVSTGYTGVYPPVNTITSNIVIIDFHAPGPSPLPLGTNTDTWNGQTAGVFSFLRHSQLVTNTLNKSYELTTNLASFTGTLPASAQSLEGVTSVATLTGAVVIPATTSLVGLESHALIQSTGGTLANAYGFISGNQLTSGSTTNVTNSYGFRVQNLSNAGTGTVTNNYGLFLDAQSGGSTRNFSVYSQGAALFASDAFGSGINFEDSAQAAWPIITEVSSNNEIRLHPTLDTAGWHWTNRANTADWLFINSTGIDIPFLALSSKTFIFDSKCASATSPAACSSSSAGAFTIAAAATTATVNTSAVSATSVILINENQSLGATLGVTCNVGTIGKPIISAVSAGVSFTITIPASLATNPVCMQYTIQ